MYKNWKISCVVPCFNEEEGIGLVLRAVPQCVDEVVVVDNASTDSTAAVARSGGAVVVFEGRKGYGQAYQAGLPAASGDMIVTLDGDCTYPLNEIEQMLSYMDANSLDLLVGCRYPLSNKAVQPFINRVANAAGSALIRALFHVGIKDAQSGMMIMRKSVLGKIMVRETGMDFSQSIKIKAFRDKSLKCGEMHISYFPRVGVSKFERWNDGIGTVRSILSLWLGSISCSKK